MTVGLRQSANPQVLKLDWGTFRLQRNEPLGRLALTASRNFFTVYPESDFAVDRPQTRAGLMAWIVSKAPQIAP